MSGDARIRVGIVGSGAGAFHARSYQSIPGVEIAGIAGMDRERTAAVAAEIGIPRQYDDYQQMFDHEELDAVSIAVPNFLHAPVALAALGKGLHVLMEKPLADSLAEAERVTQAALNSDRVFMMTFNYRFRPDSRALKQFIASGQLGEIYHVRAGWMRDNGIPGLGTWFTQKSKSGGGPLIDLGVHVLDLALWLLDYPRAVSVSASTYALLGSRGRGAWTGYRFEPGAGGFDVEDLAAAFIRLEEGASLILETSWASFSSYGDDYYLHLYGDEGGAELDVHNYALGDNLRLYRETEGIRTEIRPKLAASGVTGHEAVAEEFIAAIREGRPPNAGVEDALAVQRIIDAVYRSAEARQEIRL